MKPLGYFREDCRLCHSKNLYSFLDLGMHPHSDGFLTQKMLSEVEQFFPLQVDLCVDCGQVQINYVVDPMFLYANDEYLYDSSITQTGTEHFLSMASSIVDTFGIKPGSLAIDVGSNVGLLLSGFKQKGMTVLGVDPAPKPAKIANEQGIETLPVLFTAALAEEITKTKGKASVITATNVFAHIDDLDDFMQAVDTLLTPEGILVIEAPYFADLLEKLEYDTIYHQHLSYLSIKPMSLFCERFGMELFDVQRTSIHGGSIRLFIGRKGAHPVQPIIANLIQNEAAQAIHTEDRMDDFADDVLAHRQALIRMLVSLKDAGKTIAAVSAPAKGNTLLNYCGINRSLLQYVTEKNPMKVGLFTPGTHLPIVPDSTLTEQTPDFALILAWNFSEEIMKNLAAYQQKGGKFIVPIPFPSIV
jgi:SAM-dependent methyltransferase